MSAMALDHVTLRCAPSALPGLLSFYQGVAGLHEGPRPDFAFPGHWLYAGEVACLHLAGIGGTDPPDPGGVPDGPPSSASRSPAGIDHLALRARGLASTRERLRAAGLRFAEAPVPATHLWQVFVTDPVGVRLELGFDLLAEAAATPAPIAHTETAGIRTACARRGTGPPLLLIHGAEADHRMFDALADALAGHFTVIAYDQRDSGSTVNPPLPCTLVDLADDAAGLIRALGFERAHVYGTSLGGQIAQVLAARHPTVIDRLILGSTWRVGNRLADIAPQTAAALAALRADAARNAGLIAEHFFPPLSLRLNPAFAAMFASSSRTPEQRARRAQLLASPPAIDLTSVRAPTMVLTGELDRLVPADASAALSAAITGASFVSLPGVGHVAALQAPSDTATAITAFLAKPPSAASDESD